MAEVTRSTGGLWRRLLPALFGAGIVLPVGLALTFGMNLLLARVLPVEGYGLFAFVHSLASMAALVAALGFSTSMMRLVSSYRANGELALLRGLITNSFRLIVLAIFLVSLVLFVSAWFFPDFRQGLLWAALLVFPLTIDAWRESCMRGLHRTTAAILPRQVLLPLLTLCAVLGLDLDGSGTVLASFTTILLTLQLLGLLQLRQTLNFLSGVQVERKIGYWLRVSLPMAGARLAQQGILRWDIVVLGGIAGLEFAGPYAAAVRTALLASIVLRLVNLVAGPVLAELYHVGDLHRFRKLLVTTAVAAGITGLPLYLFVLLRPQLVLALFGADYQGAALPLQILATGQFINLVTGPVGLALTMSSHEMANLRIALVAGVVSALGLLVLVPQHQMVGAAIATAAATVFLNVGFVVLAWWHFWKKTPELV